MEKVKKQFRSCSRSGKLLQWLQKHRLLKWLFPVIGLAALIWFLVRVIPKPSRAAYPCQRVAAPLASGFLIWLFGTAGSFAAWCKARRLLRRSRFVLAGVFLLISVAALWWPLGITGFTASATPDEPLFDPCDLNIPIGEGKGVNPGRVIWAYNPDATNWDGHSGYWWQDSHTNPVVVDDMLSGAVQTLVDEPNEAGAWDAIFRYFNRTHGYGDVGYQSGENIAIKINGIQSYGHFRQDNLVNPTPQLVFSLLRQLIEEAGVPESNIVIYECVQLITGQVYDRCHAAYPGVHFADHTGGDGRVKVSRDSTVHIYYGDRHLVEDSGEVCLPAFVVNSKYLINMALFKPHVLAGVTLCAKNWFGSIWRPSYIRFEGWDPSNMHCAVAAFDWSEAGIGQSCPGRPMGSYNALVDLMGHKHLGGKTLLYIIDGLYSTPEHQGGEPLRWESPPFNHDWTSSVFVSQDPVAIDSVAIDFLRSEPTKTTYLRGTIDNYLHEAALANNPPSGTYYDPEMDLIRLQSLGVHEHWNNPIKKQYTRNLRTGEGLELIRYPVIKGDINGGGVDVEDMLFVVDYWLAEDCNCTNDWCDGVDLNRDGCVNLRDLAIVARDWLRGHIQ